MNDQTAVKILYTLHPFHYDTARNQGLRNAFCDQTSFMARHWDYRFLFECWALIEDRLASEIEADLYEHWT